MKVLKFPKKDTFELVDKVAKTSTEDLNHLSGKKEPLSPESQLLLDLFKKRARRVFNILKDGNVSSESEPLLIKSLFRASEEDLVFWEKGRSGEPKDTVIGSQVSNEKDQQEMEIEDHQEEGKERTKEKPPTEH